VDGGGRRGPGAGRPRSSWRRKEKLRSGKVVRAEATKRGFDAQRKTGGGGRPVLMVLQQVEWTAELQDLEVRAELDRRVSKYEQECSAGGRLGSIPQARAYARQPTTRMQAGGH
jgi:hypothetical protein